MSQLLLPSYFFLVCLNGKLLSAPYIIPPWSIKSLGNWSSILNWWEKYISSCCHFLNCVSLVVSLLTTQFPQNHVFISEKAKQWRKGFDQTMLTKYIWPSVKSLSLVHDSYLCKTYHSENWKPFPTKRYEASEYNFVGKKIK